MQDSFHSPLKSPSLRMVHVALFLLWFLPFALLGAASINLTEMAKFLWSAIKLFVTTSLKVWVNSFIFIFWFAAKTIKENK